MYCVSCGAPNPVRGKFCHRCGSPLVTIESQLLRRTPTEKELLSGILRLDQKPNECHRCGAETDLTRHEFAIAKVIGVKREWGETVARLGISAVSIATAPITGFAGFSWKGPDKTTSYRLLKTELVLCRSCLDSAWKSRRSPKLKDDAYRCHPWAGAASRIGYDRYLSSEEIARLKPSP